VSRSDPGLNGFFLLSNQSDFSRGFRAIIATPPPRASTLTTRLTISLVVALGRVKHVLVCDEPVERIVGTLRRESQLLMR
jgi:hypothetical protein